MPLTLRTRALRFLPLFFVTLLGAAAPLSAAAEERPLPTAAQIGWQEAELGVIFHYDLHVFDGKAYGQGANRIEPFPDHTVFAPSKLDTDQWVLAAKAAGARFAILTATHETGFGLWQSDVNPYCLKAVPWRDGKGDIVRDFVDSCRRHGLLPGIYLGIRWNAFLGIHDFRVDGDGPFARNRQQWYRRYCEAMVRELCTRYGDLFMIWFDGGASDPKGLGPDVEPIVARYQPGCLFYHNAERADLRWGGSESGTVGYPCWSSFPFPYSQKKVDDRVTDHNRLLAHGDPDGRYWVPAMADTPLRGANGRHEWFWEPGDENAVYPLADLMRMYRRSVGRNATLVLGLTPDSDGLIPEGDAARLREFGEVVRSTYGTPLAETSGEGNALTLAAEAPLTADCAVIREDIARGERIRAYRIEALRGGAWQTVAQGSSVGNRCIRHFPETVADAFRLTVDAADGTPLIRTFSLHRTGIVAD